MKRFVIVQVGIVALVALTIGVTSKSVQSADSTTRAQFPTYHRTAIWDYVALGGDPNYDTLTLGINGLAQQGYVIVSVFPRPNQPGLVDVIAIGPGSAPPPPVLGDGSGTNCPGYPNAPHPSMLCYADGGWR